MLELINTHPDVSVPDSEYQRLLGYPPSHRLEGRARELADSARQWYAEHGQPWVYTRRTDALNFTNGNLNVDGTVFVSKKLHDQFTAAQAHSAMLVVVSAGRQCEDKARELWQEGKPDEYFFMEMFGSAVVEDLVTTTGGRICAWAEQNGMTVLPHYSPGYSGWDVSDQTKLWELIRRNNAHELHQKLDVLSTGMLRPKKSLLAVFGITRHLDKVRSFRNLVPCDNCSLGGCQYRRAPFRHALPQIEDVRQLQAANGHNSTSKRNGAPPLILDAKYSVNERALRKWSANRLQIKSQRDGSIEAQFHYEGTTCSNLGRPLEFDYHVKLGPAEEGYRIIDTACVPTPGDTGHAAQCEYLNNAQALMRNIEAEKPLVGGPLNDVLTWARPYDPSGCYCDASRRAHKWGLVLEVIHYTLAQWEKQARELELTANS